MRYRIPIISPMSIFGLAEVGLNTAHAVCRPDDTECRSPRNPPPHSCYSDAYRAGVLDVDAYN